MGGGGEISHTGGVKPMSIAGRVVSERERLTGMTAEERAWRKKWLHDQVLHPNEPKYVLAERKEMLNPIRRLYRAPLDFIFDKGVAKLTGDVAAGTLRFYTGRILLGAWMTLGIVYYFKCNTNDWQGKGRWRVIRQKKAVYPGEPGYPVVSPEKEPHQYYDRGFSQSEIPTIPKVKYRTSKSDDPIQVMQFESRINHLKLYSSFHQ